MMSTPVHLEAELVGLTGDSLLADAARHLSG